ncbi:hypothetical protein Henu3_gp86 [Mycobacterium phage Henu3 PeY-2017]|nr:hypothetical protein Henu3_gp86 [Mycobacterium phage Henu3 PeY-2017]
MNELRVDFRFARHIAADAFTLSGFELSCQFFDPGQGVVADLFLRLAPFLGVRVVFLGLRLVFAGHFLPELDRLGWFRSLRWLLNRGGCVLVGCRFHWLRCGAVFRRFCCHIIRHEGLFPLRMGFLCAMPRYGPCVRYPDRRGSALDAFGA